MWCCRLSQVVRDLHRCRTFHLLMSHFSRRPVTSPEHVVFPSRVRDLQRSRANTAFVRAADIFRRSYLAKMSWERLGMRQHAVHQGDREMFVHQEFQLHWCSSLVVDLKMLSIIIILSKQELTLMMSVSAHQYLDSFRGDGLVCFTSNSLPLALSGDEIDYI